MKATRERRATELMKRDWINTKLWKRLYTFQKFKSNDYINNEEGC
jgi:hypothetical protein